MKYFIIAVSFLLLTSCYSSGKRALVGKTAYQQQLNAEFKDASKSPLTKKDLKNFKGLDFFPVDSSYIITAQLTKTPNATTIKLPTTTDRVLLYRPYGVLKFNIKGVACKLTIYKDQSPDSDPVYKDHFFLPFTDNTSGSASYGGGRYMEVTTMNENKDGTFLLNFNNTYNPYCVYNKSFSCPMTPRENHLEVSIEAGIKDFKSSEH